MYMFQPATGCTVEKVHAQGIQLINIHANAILAALISSIFRLSHATTTVS